MDKEKEREMIESLADFVIRVANGKATSETERQLLLFHNFVLLLTESRLYIGRLLVWRKERW